MYLKKKHCSEEKQFQYLQRISVLLNRMEQPSPGNCAEYEEYQRLNHEHEKAWKALKQSRWYRLEMCKTRIMFAAVVLFLLVWVGLTIDAYFFR